MPLLLASIHATIGHSRVHDNKIASQRVDTRDSKKETRIAGYSDLIAYKSPLQLEEKYKYKVVLSDHLKYRIRGTFPVIRSQSASLYSVGDRRLYCKLARW